MGFPDASTRVGKDLLDQYNAISHDVFILIWACFMAGCLVQYVRSCARDGVAPCGPMAATRWLYRHVRCYPLVAILFLIYSIGLVASATWYYPEIIGWYADVDQGDLMNHLRFVPSFVGETMKRNDFRFFPLAHQDLHVLSWLTPYVKVWAMVNALEAVAVVILVVRFVRRLMHGVVVPALPLLVTALLFLNGAFLQSFYQFIYSERLLILCLSLYIYAYLSWLQGLGQRYLPLALAAALLGAFLKDIAILLFAVPAGVRAVVVVCREGWQGLNHLQLERWIGYLMVGVLISYGVLTGLPSMYAGEGSYSSGSSDSVLLGLRTWFLLVFVLVRFWLIICRRCSFSLLDGLNAGVIMYGIALAGLVGYSERSYLALPVILVSVIDAAYLYSLLVSSSVLSRVMTPRVCSGLVLVSCSGLGVWEHRQHSGFLQAAIPMVQRQESWRNSYAAIKKMAILDRESNLPVNIIFSKDSWFNKRRHLHRLVFNRLVRFDPQSGHYDVMLGAGRGDRYKPKDRDYLLDIDGRLEISKINDSCWMLGQICYELVYQSDSGGKEGRVFRVVKDGAKDAESNNPIKS